MNNQGLDALAALAAAASHSPYPSVSNGGSDNNGGQKEAKSTTTTADAPAQAINPSIPDMAAQQWQQAIANAASSISALSGSGGQNNLALLGMQQLNQATATNPNIIAIQQQLAMQQQLNYYQLLAHAAATQQQRQFSANQVMNAATVPGTAPTAAQTLSQVLGVNAVQTTFPNLNGTLVKVKMDRIVAYHFNMFVHLYVVSSHYDEQTYAASMITMLIARVDFLRNVQVAFDICPVSRCP